MVASIDATPGGASGNGDGSLIPGIPDTARNLVLVLTGALVAIIGLAYFFLKYGDDYDPTQEDERGR